MVDNKDYKKRSLGKLKSKSILTESSMLNILFAHTDIGQFKELHTYLNATGLAKSWMLCSSEAFNLYRNDVPNLIPLDLHRDPGIGFIPRATKNSIMLSAAIDKHIELNNVDLFIGHIFLGSPIALFDRHTLPIITYAEFPCYRMHGCDPQYPPNQREQIADKHLEMLSLYTILKSNLTLTPSAYAKGLFPSEIQHKIFVQPEGFILKEPENIKTRINTSKRKIGFFARDLSSAKGFEHFLQIAKSIYASRQDVHFIVIGSAITPYGYEEEFLNDKYGANHSLTFLHYLLSKHSIEIKYFSFLGLLPEEEYQSVIGEIDLFLYPLQFGSSNWGVYRLLMQGAIVIASDRCYLPEVIEHGVNGFLLSLGSPENWRDLAIKILDDRALQERIRRFAINSSKRYSMHSIAPKYLQLFHSIAHGDGVISV